MLIKRTERQTRRSSSQRRSAIKRTAVSIAASFLRRSGLAAGGLAAHRRAAARQRPQGGSRPAPNVAGATIRKSICTHCSVGCTVTAEVSNGVWVGQEPSWEFADQPRLALRQGRVGARVGLTANAV